MTRVAFEAIVLAVLCSSYVQAAWPIFSVVRIDLGGVWLVKEGTGKYTDLVASVPGGIYTDLQNNKIIEDPVYSDNDETTKWVGRSNWTYYTNFTGDEDLLSFENINIVFEGLDTFCSVWINGVEVGKGRNMFVRYIFNVKDVLKVGNNLIEVRFLSPVQLSADEAKKQNVNYEIPPACPPDEYRGECHANYIRKMQSSFSWDWGPSLPSVGIWKPIYLEAFNSSLIRYVTLDVTPPASPYDKNWDLDATIYFADNTEHVVHGELETRFADDLSIDIFGRPILVEPDDNGDLSYKVNLNAHVSRWWPNGYGLQKFYNLTIKFTLGNETDEVVVPVAFRTVELVQEKINETGNSFYLKVNDVPIFAKGSNLIPIDILPERGQDRKKIDNLLESAKESNMNMLRVWGGGVYESDYLYEQADKLGIMIWQDFMFACALYPSSEDFLSNVLDEVRHQVKRLGKYASIVLWSGNNENEGALAYNWYNTSGIPVYRADYRKLYERTVKPELLRLSPRSIFVSSSPSNGIETDRQGGLASDPYSEFYGDVHPYLYSSNSFNPIIYPVPRFASEYGFQSLPSIDTLRTATSNASDLLIGSDFLTKRQHHPQGNDQMKLLTAFQFDLPPENDTNYNKAYIYYTQIIQAMSVKTETEHYRSYRSILDEQGRGMTMGALYWQLNDVWVAPTWSSIDYTGKWKMLQYFAKNFFAPVIITGQLNVERQLEIIIVSDKSFDLYDANMTVSVYRWDSFTPVSVTTQTSVAIQKGKANKVLTLDTDNYLTNLECGNLNNAKSNCFFVLNLKSGDQVLAPENYVLPDTLKNCNLTRSNIHITSVKQLDDEGKNFAIEINSSNIALFVWLDAHNITGKFYENGFMQIEESRTVYFDSDEKTDADKLKTSLTISDLLNYENF